MGREYRNWEERRQIIRSIIASSNPLPLESFDLTPSEDVYFRARAAKAVDKLARSTSTFKAYYQLPTDRPFGYVIGVVALVVASASMAAIYILLHAARLERTYPLFGALGATIVAAIGWAVAGWISHRNTVRQNTNAMLFARFSQAPFGEALHRFHSRFGYDVYPRIDRKQMSELRNSKDEVDQRAAASVSYLLNYYELLAAGVLRGDLNQDMVRDNSRGLIIFYYDKCEPHIRALNLANHRTYENLIKIRTHYREP